MMPGDEQVDLYLNVCFRNIEAINYSRLVDYANSNNLSMMDHRVLEYSTKFKNRFEISYKFDELSERLYFSISRYIHPPNICYQVQGIGQEFDIKRNIINNVTFIQVGYSLGYPNIHDYDNFVSLYNIGVLETKEVVAKQNTFVIKKLEYPYTDNCLYYTKIDIEKLFIQCTIDKYNALGRSIYVSEYESKYENLTYSDSTIGCSEITPDNDKCDRVAIFSYIQKEDIEHSNLGNDYINIAGDWGDLPQFVIQSKPRIDNIDYVTYIFGTFGSWIGFSFLMLNPIPLFFVSDKSSNIVDPTPDTASDAMDADKERMITKINQLIAANNRTNVKFNRIESILIQLDGKLESILGNSH